MSNISYFLILLSHAGKTGRQQWMPNGEATLIQSNHHSFRCAEMQSQVSGK